VSRVYADTITLDKGVEHPGILVSAGAAGTNPHQYQRSMIYDVEKVDFVDLLLDLSPDLNG
jgi:ABC-type Zn2+ transport system substrate-binding protein/surface adhesin